MREPWKFLNQKEEPVPKPKPLSAKELVPVQAPVSQGTEQAAEGVGGPALQAAPVAPKFQDYTAPKAVQNSQGKTTIFKGEVRTFKTERAAQMFAKSQTLPATWKPRDTGEGWVLSKPVTERTEAQRAAASDRAKAVRTDDDAATILRKLGGVRVDALDGADPKSIESANKSGFGPVFRKGGLTLDGVAEALAGEGFDVLDEAGRPDATKANEIIHDILAGNRVYSPEGQMMQAAREQERRAKGMEPTPEEQAAGTTVQSDAADVARVVDLTMLDETTAERLALQFENDDAGYLAAVEEALNDQDHAAVADGETRGQAPAGAEASLSRDEALAALRQAVEAIRAASPEETTSLTPRWTARAARQKGPGSPRKRSCRRWGPTGARWGRRSWPRRSSRRSRPTRRYRSPAKKRPLRRAFLHPPNSRSPARRTLKFWRKKRGNARIMTPSASATTRRARRTSRSPAAIAQPPNGPTPRRSSPRPSKVETYAPGEVLQAEGGALKENWKERMVQGVFDAYAPLKRLGPTEYIKARMVKSADGALEGTLLYGKPKMGDDGAIYGDIDKKGFLGRDEGA
jgi:hypothetical protein